MGSRVRPAFLVASTLKPRINRALRPDLCNLPHRHFQVARLSPRACAQPASAPDRGNTLVLVGLGNTGPRFAKTRHNVGFEVADLFVARNGGTFTVDKKLQADVARTQLAGCTVHIVKPRTFMNLSGSSVRSALKWFNAPSAALLVVADDMSLEVGRLRLRTKGSAGGHNGLKSVEGAIGSREYARLKVGVGGPRMGAEEWRDHVLGKFSKGERAVLEDVLLDCVEVLELWAREPQIERVISRMGTVKGGRR